MTANPTKPRSGQTLTQIAKEKDMLKDTLNMVAQALAIYALLIGGYWLFVG
jgi:hypothetical protein